MSGRHRTNLDPNALTKAQPRLIGIKDDDTLKCAHVDKLGRVVQHRAALIVPAGHPPDPAAPADDGVGVVLDRGRHAFLHTARKLLLDCGADHLRFIRGEQHSRLTRRTPHHVARGNQDTEDCAGSRSPNAAFLQGKLRLLAASLGRLQLEFARARPRPRHPGPAAPPVAGPLPPPTPLVPGSFRR